MTTVMLDRELTDEGKKIWENMSSYQVLSEGGTLLPIKRVKKIRINLHEIENEFFRLELKRLIRNSQMVIEDCDGILKKCRTMHEYIANDAKVAKTIHTNMIERFTKLLNLIPAFEHEIILPG